MADPIPTPPPSRPWLKYAVNAAVLASMAAGWVLFLTGHATTPPPLPVFEAAAPAGVGEAATQTVNFGWTPDPAATRIDAQADRFRTFADTPAGQGAGMPSEVFLWKGVEKLTGKPTPLKDQNPTGSCVGFGTTTAIERTEATEILTRGGDPSEYAFFAEEVTYAGSKVQGARLAGGSVSRSDGSSGVFCKAFFTQYGMCPEGKYGGLDLTEYDAARAHAWNTSGPPADILEVCKRYPVQDVVKVTNWAEFKQAVANGYAVSICADWKYSGPRDARGVAQDLRSGWGHCMCGDGYHVEPDGTEYGHIENSWSNLPDASGRRTGKPYHTGPVGWGNPTTAGFWATSASIDRALKQGDSFAYSGVTGFPARRVDWFASSPARRRTPETVLALAW